VGAVRLYGGALGHNWQVATLLRLHLPGRPNTNARLPPQRGYRRTTYGRSGSALLLDSCTPLRWVTRPGTGARDRGYLIHSILEASPHLNAALYARLYPIQVCGWALTSDPLRHPTRPDKLRMGNQNGKMLSEYLVFHLVLLPGLRLR
jgi:hypothetical protein